MTQTPRATCLDKTVKTGLCPCSQEWSCDSCVFNICSKYRCPQNKELGASARQACMSSASTSRLLRGTRWLNCDILFPPITPPVPSVFSPVIPRPHQSNSNSDVSSILHWLPLTPDLTISVLCISVIQTTGGKASRKARKDFHLVFANMETKFTSQCLLRKTSQNDGRSSYTFTFSWILSTGREPTEITVERLPLCKVSHNNT